VVAFIVSFFPYYGASVHAGGFSQSVSVNAWHGTALVGLLFIFAATIVAAMQAFARESLPNTGMSWNFVVVGLSAIGTILVFLRSVTLPSGSGAGVDYGVRWGGILLIIVCVVHTAFAVLRFRDTGEALPWQSPAAHPPAA
jgi:LPXTG-motif cell wall-anchored protein